MNPSLFGVKKESVIQAFMVGRLDSFIFFTFSGGKALYY